MRVKIAKWGNSAAIRLPKAVMEGLNLDEGSELDVKLVGNELRAVPGRPAPCPSFDDLIAEMHRLGGADYDFGAEEWHVLPTEIGEYDGVHDGKP